MALFSGRLMFGKEYFVCFTGAEMALVKKIEATAKLLSIMWRRLRQVVLGGGVISGYF